MRVESPKSIRQRGHCLNGTSARTSLPQRAQVVVSEVTEFMGSLEVLHDLPYKVTVAISPRRPAFFKPEPQTTPESPHQYPPGLPPSVQFAPSPIPRTFSANDAPPPSPPPRSS